MEENDWTEFCRRLAEKADAWRHFLRVGDSHSWVMVNAYFASILPQDVVHQLSSQQVKSVIKRSARLQNIKKRRVVCHRERQIAKFWNPQRIDEARIMAEERRDYLVADL